MSARVTIKGGDKLLKALREMPREMTAEVRERIKAEAAELAAEMRAAAPIDTGALRESIVTRSRAGGLRVAVGIFGMSRKNLLRAAAAFRAATGITGRKSGRISSQLIKAPFYAHYVEFGTRKTPAQPFLYPTFRRRRPAIIVGVGNAAKRAIRKFVS